MKSIKFNEPYITGNELTYIEDVFRCNHFYGNGKYTKLCQDLIKEKLSATQVLLTDSCTSALEIAALLLRVDGTAQEVILPSYTFSSTASAFVRAGFKVSFAEIDPHDMMLDLASVEACITDKTVAIVAVHYGGCCADLQGLRKISDKYGLALVEDAAQAYCCFLDDRALGTFGDLACFSFHETKNIHAGLSGALLVNREEFSTRAVHIWERGTNRQEVLKGVVDKYSWVEVGGSFYPTELQAAFLYAQLCACDENVAERKVIYEAYVNGLKDLKAAGALHFPDLPKSYQSNYHAFFIRLNSETDCDMVREALVAQNIAAYIGYVPLHSSTVGKKMGYREDSLPVTEEYAKRILRLPFHNNLSIEDVQLVCDVIKTCGLQL